MIDYPRKRAEKEMKMEFRSLPLAACAIICLQSAAAVQGVDQIFTNEKFATVDDRFRPRK